MKSTNKAPKSENVLGSINCKIVTASINSKTTAAAVNYREFIVEAVKNYSPKLQHASDDLRRDHQIISLAIKQSPRAIKFAKIDMSDADLILQLISINGECLTYFDNTTKNNLLFAKTAVQQVWNSKVLRNTSDIPYEELTNLVSNFRLRADVAEEAISSIQRNFRME